MKRIVSFLFVSLLCVCMVLPCFAMEFQNPAVVDLAGYLTEDELADITMKLDAIREKYQFEVAIVTEREMSGVDAMSTADDIYDYTGYGAGENDDGILLYICSSARQYHITTHADGLRVFNDTGILYLQMNIEPYLTEDDYYHAMDTFATLADELLMMAANGEPFDELPNDLTYVLVVLGFAIIIPLIIAKIATGIKLAMMKTAVADDYAADYMKEGTKRLEVSRDIFLYSRITKIRKPKETSTSHKSSSGRTHGGGGGSF